MAPDETTAQATGLVHNPSAVFGILWCSRHTHEPTFTPIVPSFSWRRLGQLLGNALAASITWQTRRGLFWPHGQHLLNCPLKWPHLALFAFFCMSHSALGQCKTLPDWALGKYKLHCTRLCHNRGHIKGSEKCDTPDNVVGILCNKPVLRLWH